MSMMTDMMKSMGMPMTGKTMDLDMAQSCIEACAAASQAATMCADADLTENMARCAAMCSNTADVATAMMRMMMRPNGYEASVTMPMLEACVAMGSACAAECRMHSEMHDHCRICAMACDAMVAACSAMMATMR